MPFRPQCPETAVQLRIQAGLKGIDARAWDRLVGSGDPFLEYGFLAAMEESGVVGEATAWQPRYVIMERKGTLVGAVPLFIKWDSYGEFIFDWQWAQAFQRSGIPYYPKGVVAAPFTPAAGPRILLADPAVASNPADAAAMIGFMNEFSAAEGLSGIHALFCTEAEQRLLGEQGYAPRLTHQFHWINQGYQTFEDYLGALRSKKRKQIRRERESVLNSGVEIEVFSGEALREEHLEAMWKLYVANAQRAWGQMYLNRATFDLLLEYCRHTLLLVMARAGDEWIGGSLCFVKGPNLYGRYWGATCFVPNLHFECCYYRLIEHAIEQRLELFEAGAQGEHKFLRGFVASPTYSAHRIEHPGARRAIEGFLDEERRHGAETIAGYNRVSPVKTVRRGA